MSGFLKELLLLKQERRFSIFHKILLSKPVRRKLYTPASLSDKVEGYRLKTDPGAGAFF